MLLKYVTTESPNRRWHKNATVLILGRSQCMNNTIDINISGQIRVHLAKSRQNAGQMHNIINLIVLDQVLILCCISHIKLLIPARKLKLLI